MPDSGKDLCSKCEKTMGGLGYLFLDLLATNDFKFGTVCYW